MGLNINATSPVSQMSKVTTTNKKTPGEKQKKGKVEAPVTYQATRATKQAQGYNKKGHVYNKKAIDKMKADAELKYQELIGTVRAMLQKQGVKYQDVLKAVKNGKDVKVNIDDDTRQKAQEAISENGYYGVKQTSERLIDFAKKVSGNNPALFDKLASSIKAGFEAAKKAFGDKLPEISQKTYDATMEGLKAWRDGKDNATAKG